MQSILLPGRCNTHTHLRDDFEEDGAQLEYTAPTQAEHFDVCVPMSNTKARIGNAEQAKRYRDRGNRWAPDLQIRPTLFLSLNTSAQDIREARDTAAGAKLYIDGTTTNSTFGVPIERISELTPLLYAMTDVGMPLIVHVEDPRAPFRARERTAVPVFREIAEAHPELPLIFAHTSTKLAAETFLDYENVWLEVTPHHLWLTEDAVWGDPDHLCMPVVKSAEDRAALRKLLASGHPRVLAGLDDAPHKIRDKRRFPPGKKPPSGIWNVAAAIPIYASVLEAEGNLDALRAILWDNPSRLYRIPPAWGRPVQVVRKPFTVPVEYNPERPQHFLAGETLDWSVESVP